MRYIIGYRVYENINDDVEEAAYSSFSTLIDKDFEVKIDNNNQYVIIMIFKKNMSSFFHYEVYDNLMNFIDFLGYETKYFAMSNTTTIEDMLKRKLYKKKFDISGFYNNRRSSKVIRINFNKRDKIIKVYT